MKKGSARGGTIGDRGQIAIFVALIFQVLFVFFAMVVNVGLVVHHKINLQNSVDLAAYYGAMKQAEALNAVSHINYQIRQAWKLMVWRYRHLGMAGDTVNHPYDSLNKILRGSGNIDQPFTAANGNACPATFCINHPIFDIQEPWEYYCRDMCNGVNITLIGIPAERGINFALAEGILGGLARAIEDASRNLVDKTKQHCRNRSALNWFALARFIFAYKQEMKNRKQVLNKIANGLSYDTKDFQDIEGDSARQGALSTLWRNLSPPNQEQIDLTSGTTKGGTFAFYNSLGEPQCGGNLGNEQTPPKWLNENFLKPIYYYLEGDCDGDTSIGFTPKPVNTGSAVYRPKYTDGLDAGMVDQLMQLIVDPSDLNAGPNRLWATTAGYEKNPWCMAYVGVEATTQPKIPFSPFDPPKLTARAFAKPFGGRVGPWYYKAWPSGSMFSQGGPNDAIDGNLPPRVVSGEEPPALNNDNLRADFSRYTGDKIGTKSTLTMGQASQSLWQRHQPPNQASWNYYAHLLSGADLSDMASPGDILAWNSANNSSVPLRDVEVAFVAPDQFDITYYSIEPDFWRNYAQRIQKRSDFAALQVRGDLGFRKGATGIWPTMTIKDQLQYVRGGNGVFNYGALSYYIGQNRAPAMAFVEALTSWHAQQPGNYALENDRFGNCPDSAVIPDNPTAVDTAVPSDCAFGGGRTGYSVKMVDGEYLQGGNLELGGQGQTGGLINRWSEQSFGH